jgi:NAD+ kinase
MKKTEKMKIAVYGRVFNKSDVDVIQQLFDCLHKHHLEPVIFSNYYDLIKNHVKFKGEPEVFQTHHDIINVAECMMSIGGDGTLLDTVALVRDSGIPIVGMNVGRLGFLASTGKDDIEATIKSITDKSYAVDKRMLIHVDSNKPIFGEVNYGLNEFSIHKKDSSSMIIIHTYINGELLNSYWADGLIVATPTGSTGYNLSCGGPIIFPTSESFVITPIAPHNLNVRPIVVSSDSILSFEIEGRSESFLCTLDARYQAIDTSYQLAVRKESFTIGLLRINEINFLHTLRNKLMWGLDKRN